MLLLGVDPTDFGLHTEINTTLALQPAELKEEAQVLTELIDMRNLQLAQVTGMLSDSIESLHPFQELEPIGPQAKLITSTVKSLTNVGFYTGNWKIICRFLILHG